MKKILSNLFSDKYSAYTFLGLIICYLIIFAHYQIDILLSIPISLSSISIIIPIFLVDGIKIFIESSIPKQYFTAREDLSKVSVIIPTKDGGDTLVPTLTDLTRRFNRDLIIVASNGSTDNTAEIAHQFGVKLVDIPQAVGKVGAINIALSAVKTPYTLIMDDDTLLGQAVIPTNVLDMGYEGAAFKVLPLKEGWLSVLQLHEYRKSMDIGRRFHNAQGTVQNISGAIGLFHTKELQRQIHLHSGEFSGEDLQRTLLIQVSDQRKGVVIVDSLVETYVPKKIKDLFNQRIFGWNPGTISNLKLYLHLVFARKVDFKLRLEALYNILLILLLDPIRLITLPILLFSPTYLLIFYVSYVVLESFPYFAMGAKEPFWVVLVSPIYGIFNFITRIASFASFTYRRLTYYIAKAEKFDDYRKAPLRIRLASFSLTIIFYFLLLGFYSFFWVVPLETKTKVANQFSQIVHP